MILKLIKIFVRRKHAIAIMKYILQVSTIKMITYTAPVYIVTPATVTFSFIIANYF